MHFVVTDNSGKVILKIGQRHYSCINCNMHVVVPGYDERSKLCNGCSHKVYMIRHNDGAKEFSRHAARRRRQRTQYEKRLRVAYPNLPQEEFQVSCHMFTFVNGYHGVAMSENGTNLSMGIVKVDSNKPDWDWEAMQQAKA